MASDKDYILSSIDGIQLINTKVKGPLSPGTFGLIIGRSSNYKKNFDVLPGVIDADYEGEIKIMVKPLKETIQIHKNQRVAQILLLNYLKTPNPVLRQQRGTGGFGSTEMVAWSQEITQQRPFKEKYSMACWTQELIDLVEPVKTGLLLGQ